MSERAKQKQKQRVQVVRAPQNRPAVKEVIWTLRPSSVLCNVMAKKMARMAASRRNRTDLITRAVITAYWPKDSKIPCPVKL